MIECKRKLMWEAHERYKASEITNLWQAYGRHSMAKEEAMCYCINIAHNLHWSRFGAMKIIGHNCNTFSVGFYGRYNDEIVFVYITKDYDRYIKLSDLLALEEKYGGCDD